jgi:hypothetical protein
LWAETSEGWFDALAQAVVGRGRRRGVRLTSALVSGSEEPTRATLEALAEAGVELSRWRPEPASAP